MFLTLPKSWDFHAQTNKLCILTSFNAFSSCFTHVKWFFVIFFAFFLAQNFITKVWTTQKKSTFRMSVYTLHIWKDAKYFFFFNFLIVSLKMCGILCLSWVVGFRCLHHWILWIHSIIVMFENNGLCLQNVFAKNYFAMCAGGLQKLKI